MKTHFPFYPARVAVLSCTILLALVLIGCAAGSYNAPKHQVGQTFRDHIIVGSFNTNIPLPEGEWTLIGYGKWTNNNNTKFNQLFLAQINSNKLEKFIEVTASDENHDWGYSEKPFCKRQDVLHLVKRVNSAGGNQDCWGINHWTMTLGNESSKFWEQGFKYLRSTNTEIPLTALVVGFNKANNRSSLIVNYGSNPELAGLAPSKQAHWSVNDWHKDRYYNDKAKVAYVNLLKSWGEKWDPKVNNGFKGKLPEVQPHAGRLAALQELLDSGAISQPAFDKKKQEILDSL